MCGIVGIIDHHYNPIPPGLLTAMRDVMFLRGPDGEGHYVDGNVGMAMRRLSIIDLSGGWQPFYSANFQVVVFQNGEIYNYRELKRQLESKGKSFISNSDTEVIAHGYAEWGMDGLLQRIDGMYAIAILDRRSRQMHLARDRFGEKPLFYTHSPGRFAYSSNLLSLAALPWVDNDVDPLSLNRYLATHFVPGQRTILKGVSRVLPGEYLTVAIDDPVPHKTRYYTTPLLEPQDVSDDALADLLEEAVTSRLTADVPVGVFLSGGLDSSIVTAIAAKRSSGIDTFSIGFEQSSHDESRFAQEVARQTRSTHHHFIFEEKVFLDLLPKVAAALDEPVGDQAMLPLYWLCQEARKYVTVVLSGEAADEIFAGYSYYAGYALDGNRNSAGVHKNSSLIESPHSVTPSGFPLLTDIAARKRFTEEYVSAPDGWEMEMIAWLNHSGNSLQRATAADLATWLPDDLLVKFDRMAMAHSLEGRAPYLSPRVVEAGLNLPEARRLINGKGKLALKNAGKKWIPKKIIERKKQGFVLPMAQWIKQWFAQQGSVAEYFRHRAVPGLNMAEIGRWMEENVRGEKTDERLAFAILLLVEWYKAFSVNRESVAIKYRSAE